MQEMWVWSLHGEDVLEKEMATHSSILAWRIPWTEEPGGHDLATKQKQAQSLAWGYLFSKLHHLLYHLPHHLYTELYLLRSLRWALPFLLSKIFSPYEDSNILPLAHVTTLCSILESFGLIQCEICTLYVCMYVHTHTHTEWDTVF